MVFRVMNLSSLANLFPSLTIVRGYTLISNYAVILYELDDLEEVSHLFKLLKNRFINQHYA